MDKHTFNILVLDGGGSKGVYTLGVLQELELKLGGRLHEHFDLIYGTSTGAIIGSLIALGRDIKTIQSLYLDIIPEIMSPKSKSKKSENLKTQADKVFGESTKFDSFKTNIGIVSLNYDTQEPLIFKSDIAQSHGMKHSFEAGFGCTISDAVQSSCSAYPVFDKKIIETTNKGILTVIDGGFIANNATLFALIDAHKSLKIEEREIRILNIGVGQYIEKPMGWKSKFLKKLNLVQFIERVITASTNTNVLLSKLLFSELKSLRISDTYSEPEYGTNMIETNNKKLKKLIQLGRTSFAKYEKDIDSLFG
ncbi:patatin-like phospholipase family protein [Cocleimonas sp. KMM 6892]|uniref:patatin-like phospholipase family protein n=1 Tax=unclassified Cocleimonas TaxID=2639732 RepID=UPI002DBBF2AB|nr:MULTISPECIES: patatin-like phospholipase family protein [unclassified Cocleimonas]MEB8432617.1 patatin-like phospholipase family protein [Cocleimonas sp. KMM 6892]MEC4715476.1 patatin-like phospholipase family protein [Cocleimonas sp. KMM 6895]MEC4744906.1 patatin-like phospholipase family protein [Cocleimonas sp. KMM 6896]